MATIIRTSFYQGVKSTFDPIIIPENSMWRALNVRSDQSGILRLREGSNNVFPSLGELNVQGFIYAFEQLIFVWGKRVYKFDKETNALALIQDVDVTATETENVNLVRWSTGGAEIVYIFGGNGIFQTDGNTVTPITPYVPDPGEEANMLDNPTGPQNCKIAVLKASLSQRVAVSGFEDSPNTIYLSSPLDVTYFPESQVIQLPDDGAKITGLINWNNALIIFRDRDIWSFFGTDLTDPSAALVLQDGSIGCLAPKSIVPVPELGICFLGNDNIYALRNVTAIENQAKAISISDDVSLYVRSAIKDGNLEDVPAVYHNREYRICFPNAIQDERVFRLFLQNGAAWYTDNGPLTNNYVVIKGELYGSYFMQGSLHHITADTKFDETVYETTSYYAGMYNDFMYNEAESGSQFRELRHIPYSITFKREDLQPGPARIKRIFLYVMSLGVREERIVGSFGNMFNEPMYNESKSQRIAIDTTDEQHFKLSAIVDGNEIQLETVFIHSKKLEGTIISRSEPVRVYEAIIRPSIKGHFVQLKVESTHPGELLSILGYGIDYQPKGRIRGIRDGVTNNKK